MRLLLPFLLLAGCTSLVPSTLGQISDLSPLDADPAGIEVALSLPPEIDVRTRGAVLIMGAEHDGPTRSRSYVLDRGEVASVGGAVPEPSGRILVYRIARGDLAGLRAWQAQIRAWKEDDPETRGSLSVSLSPCLRGAAVPENATGAVWLRAEADGEFLPLVRPTPLVRLVGEETMATLDPCD